jgi:hypothetical protein
MSHLNMFIKILYDVFRQNDNANHLVTIFFAAVKGW